MWENFRDDGEASGRRRSDMRSRATRLSSFLSILLPIAAAFCAPAATTAQQEQRYSRAVIRTEAEPGVRYSSGLTVCDEALRRALDQ